MSNILAGELTIPHNLLNSYNQTHFLNVLDIEKL